MASNNAKEVFRGICKSIDEMGFRYSVDEDKNQIMFEYKGEDFDTRFLIQVNGKAELINVFSRLPFVVPQSKMYEMAVAVCVASNTLIDGYFDLDMDTGELFFKMTISFKSSKVGESVGHQLAFVAPLIVEANDDTLYDLATGKIDLPQFLAKHDIA